MDDLQQNPNQVEAITPTAASITNSDTALPAEAAVDAAGSVYPPEQPEIMFALIRELAAGEQSRADLRQKLEDRFQLTAAQKSVHSASGSPLWMIRFRHGLADLAKAGLIKVEKRAIIAGDVKTKAEKRVVVLTDAGRAVAEPGDLDAIIRQMRRGKAAAPITRQRMPIDLPSCGIILRAILEAAGAAPDGKIGNDKIASAVAERLQIASPVIGQGGHDMLKARIAASSHRLWKAGLLDRIGNGRRFVSALTELGRQALSDPAKSPIRLPAPGFIMPSIAAIDHSTVSVPDQPTE